MKVIEPVQTIVLGARPAAIACPSGNITESGVGQQTHLVTVERRTTHKDKHGSSLGVRCEGR